MYRLLSAFLFLLGHSYSLTAQVLPKEGGILNYTLIGFSFGDEVKKTAPCIIEIAKGNYNSEDSFTKNIIKIINFSGKKVIGQVPSFGCQYTWRWIIAGGHASRKGVLHHFSTFLSPDVDTNNLRLRIIQPADKYKDAFTFSDGSAVLYDMNGSPVWDFPDKIKELKNGLRDIKLSPQGTITFISGESAYEINYDGDILWKAPDNGVVSGERSEHYHHEFTRLANGHYMLLGNEFLLCKSAVDSISGIVFADTTKGKTISGNEYHQIPFGTVIEYDEQGKVVWFWRSSDYVKSSDLINYKVNGNLFNELHENAFSFDEKNKELYVSFRNVSRVIKIKYPEGNVISSYGEIYRPGIREMGNGMFCGQHACKYSEIGCLFLFNNNGCNRGAPPKIKIFKEPMDMRGGLKKIWEYECTVEGNYPKDAHSGGNVIALPDNTMFVCMSGMYSKLFIVNQDKKVLWSAIAEKCDHADSNKWIPVIQYRASIITYQNQLEKLIWHKKCTVPAVRISSR